MAQVTAPASERQTLDVASEVVRQFSGVAGLEQLGEKLVTALGQALRADASALYVAREGDELLLSASRGLTAAERQQAQSRAAAGHPGWVVRHRQPLLCGDATQDPRVLHVGRAVRHQSILCVPLVAADGHAVGAIEVSARSPYAFQAADLQVLQAVALHAAIVVGNAAQVAAAEHRADRLERISMAGQGISAALGIPELVERSARIVGELFGVSDTSVYLLAPNGTVELSAHHGSTGRPAAVRPGDIAQLLARPGPLAIPDLRDAPGLSDVYLRLIESGVHSLLVMPIALHSRLIGGLLLFARLNEPPFDREAQEMARIVAGQIAVAVENARLYDETVEARHRTESVVRLASAGILTLDARGVVREANPAAAEILGTPATRLVGKHIDKVLGVPFWQDPSGPLAEVRGTGQTAQPTELRLASGHLGGERDVLVGVARLPDGYLLSMADVTHLKELDRLKTQLIANVSHELRSPLTGIKAYAELLREGLDKGDAALRDQFLAVIEHQADRLGQTIGNLLDLARIEAEGYQLRRETFDLGALVADAVDAVAVRAASQSVRITTCPLPRPVLLFADRPLLASMLKNLLDNAVKFSPEGGRVIVRAALQSGRITIAVRDFGVGIPEEERGQLFQKFSRLPSAARLGVEGTGLGLVIARQAARAHGGDIRVRSGVGKGSTFTVVLPIGLVVADEGARPTSLSAA